MGLILFMKTGMEGILETTQDFRSGRHECLLFGVFESPNMITAHLFYLPQMIFNFNDRVFHVWSPLIGAHSNLSTGIPLRAS